MVTTSCGTCTYLAYCLSIMFDLQVLRRKCSPIALCFISHVTGAWCPVGLLFDLVALMVFSGDNKPQSYSLCNFFSLPLVVSSLLDPNIILSTLSTNTFTLYYDSPSFTPVYFSRQNYSSVY
jgi:hypothetical protein